MNKQIIIVIKGGLVLDVYSDCGDVRALILDQDMDGAEEESIFEFEDIGTCIPHEETVEVNSLVRRAFIKWDEEPEPPNACTRQEVAK